MKKSIVIFTLLFTVLVAFSQTKTITGKVTDENGFPVRDASVTIKETQSGVTTDANGNYSIPVDGRARKIVYSFVGKAPEEITIGNRSVINVTLKQEESAMKEIIVVAYGTQNKKRVTGAIGKVDGSELENKPFTSVDQMLQGKVARPVINFANWTARWNSADSHTWHRLNFGRGSAVIRCGWRTHQYG